MHFLHRKIKSDARKALNGNWGKAVASTMLFASICAFFYLLGKFFVKVLDITDTIDLLHVSAELRSGSYLPDILAFLLILFEIAAIFLIAAPIFLGILRWYSRTVLYGSEEITAIFYYFSKPKLFFNSLFLILNLVCRKVFWGLICLIPGGLVAGISFYIVSLNPQGQHILFSKICIFAGIALMLAGMILFLLIATRYSLACYLMADEDSLSPTRCIRLSSQYTLQYRGEILRFSLSFLPWWLVCILLFPLFFLLPYFLTAFSIYARYLIELNQRQEGGCNPPPNPCEPEEKAYPEDVPFHPET